MGPGAWHKLSASLTQRQVTKEETSGPYTDLCQVRHHVTERMDFIARTLFSFRHIRYI